MYGTFVPSASAVSGRKARVAILTMVAIVICSMVALSSMFPETYASSSELRQTLAAHSAVHHSAPDNVDHLQVKWQKDEAALKADRAVLRKEEAAFAKDMQQVQHEVGLQRKVVTDDKNLEDVELTQLPHAEFEYHEAAAQAVVEPETHGVYLLDAKQNLEVAVEREIREQQQQLKSDLTAFRQHKHVQLDINKEAAALSAEEKKLEADKARLKSDILKAGKQIKVSRATNAMLAADWSDTVNNLEEIKKVEDEVETKKRQMSIKYVPKAEAGGKQKSAVQQHLSGDNVEHLELKGQPKPKKKLAVKQHLSEDDGEHLGTYEEATDSRAAAALAGFAAADVAGQGGKACEGENCGPSVFGAKKVPQVSKAHSVVSKTG